MPKKWLRMVAAELDSRNRSRWGFSTSSRARHLILCLVAMGACLGTAEPTQAAQGPTLEFLDNSDLVVDRDRLLPSGELNLDVRNNDPNSPQTVVLRVVGMARLSGSPDEGLIALDSSAPVTTKIDAGAVKTEVVP